MKEKTNLLRAASGHSSEENLGTSTIICSRIFIIFITANHGLRYRITHNIFPHSTQTPSSRTISPEQYRERPPVVLLTKKSASPHAN
jgi:hypothetical protein